MANPFVHNAKVLWIMGGKYFPVHECHDVHYAVARQYASKHRHDPQYAKGILVVVSMLKIIPGIKPARRNKWIKASS